MSNSRFYPIASGESGSSAKKGILDSARGSNKINQISLINLNVHQAVAEGVEMVLKKSAASRSLDNITCLILGLNNFENTVQKLCDGTLLHQIRENFLINNKAVTNGGMQRMFDRFDESEIIPEDFYNIFS